MAKALQICANGFCCQQENAYDDIKVYTALKTHQQRTPQERRKFIAAASLDNSCMNCFLSVHGISKSTFCRIRRQSQGHTFLHGNKGTRKPRTAVLLAEEWVRDYAIKAGDHMPDFDEIHLPEFTWNAVWNRSVQELGSNVALNKQQFTRIGKNLTRPRVKVTQSKRFSKCNHCVRLKTVIRQSVGIRKNYWKNEHEKHNDWQMRERKKMAKHVQKATNPGTKDKYMVIEMDNMDNAKTQCPQMPREPKDLDKKTRLTTHITGVHIPGESKPFRCYTWHDRFPTGSDTVLTLLLKILDDLEGPHPETLYLHLDNCWRENKNKYLLSLTHLLVGKGVFKKIKICFLPVGHTHNIVDQMFSRFSVALKTENIFTVDDLHRACRKGYNAKACKCGLMSRWHLKKDKLQDVGCECPQVEVVFKHIDMMACWSPIILLHIPTNVVGVSKPRCFRVKRDSHGVVRHHYRNQLHTTTDQDTYARNLNGGVEQQPDGSPFDLQPQELQWMPHNQKGYQLFSEIPDELDVYQVPLKSIDTDALEETRKTLEPYLDDVQKTWWLNRIATFKTEDERSESLSFYLSVIFMV